MNKRATVLAIAIPLLCLAIGESGGVSSQSPAAFTVDANWARLPPGMTWNGNTTWITADGKGQVVALVRTAPYVRVFRRDGTFVKAWGDAGMFQSAHSVTLDAEGNLWITDSSAHIVQKFSADGRLLTTLGKKGVAGDNASQDLFNQPNHVAVAPNGDIYVSDGYGNSRVVQFSGEGRFIRIIGGIKGSEPGQLQLPHGVALDSKGRILVNDSDNKRVSVFDKDGRFVETWPYASRGGIAVAADDTVYVSDVNANAVTISKNGTLIATVNVGGRAHGMGIDTDGSIYVSTAAQMTVAKITKAK